MAPFTSLNGGSPEVIEEFSGSEDAHLAASEQLQSTGPSQQTVLTATQEATGPRTSPEAWSASATGRPGFEAPPSFKEAEGSNKRKRTESPAPSREQTIPNENGHERQRTLSRDRLVTPSRDQRSSHGDEGGNHSDPWYSQQSRDNRGYSHDYSQSAAPDSALTDDQSEAMHRADDHYPQTSPDGEDGPSLYSGSYSGEYRRDGVVQIDPKKRKRNFSNRTKTGCMTCRKRKKKCDEAKPECCNCIKGGFVCQGYPPQRGAWASKPDNKSATIQIESKDPTYVPPGAYGMPQQQGYGNSPVIPPQQQKRDPPPLYRGQALRIEPPQGRPLHSDDDRPTASTLPSASIASPENKLSALSAYTQIANVFPTPVSAAPVPFPDRTPNKEYQRVPPLHRSTDSDGHSQGTTLPQISIMHATRSNSPHAQPPPPPPPPSSGAQATAQLALSHSAQFPPVRPRREKEEMIAGRPYYPFDKELVLERERCLAACWRFNNSTNPNNGVSPTERARLFREILQPREGVQVSPSVTSPVTHTGRIGNDVVVEAPFTADYGYNIHIGRNAVIGRNCTIIDTCEVTIGDNVIIGPNVCIYTATLPTDYRRRQGSRGTQFGKPIIIEEDVWIGANVTILPGVRIGKGTTVGANSLVTKDLQKFCVCFGSPAKVHRGVVSV